ncbi:MAG TPA: SpoIIE family protein phosphatase [Tepidisphaeraceae bacterium]|nr:SpoIIE family protein phosphatase [Tepidisphaeraceae bacterium]
MSAAITSAVQLESIAVSTTAPIVPAETVRAAPPPPPLVAAAPAVESALDAVQRELDGLRSELETLRRRDDSLRYYAHRLDEELRLAARLQQDFLPKSLPKVGPVRFHTLFRPAGHVSGDLYDVMRLDEGHVGFYMADAVGHGMPAALLTMFLKQALVTKEISAAGYRLLEPAQTMARLNDALVGQKLSHATFATALYGHVDARLLQLTFARGGHPEPLLLTAAGDLRVLEADGSLLGIFPDETFAQATVQLAPGDRVFLYSDGIELICSPGDTPDAQRWRDELKRRAGQATDEILADFGAEAARVAADDAGRPRRDDLTVIVIEVA